MKRRPCGEKYIRQCGRRSSGLRGIYVHVDQHRYDDAGAQQAAAGRPPPQSMVNHFARYDHRPLDWCRTGPHRTARRGRVQQRYGRRFSRWIWWSSRPQTLGLDQHQWPRYRSASAGCQRSRATREISQGGSGSCDHYANATHSSAPSTAHSTHTGGR